MAGESLVAWGLLGWCPLVEGVSVMLREWVWCSREEGGSYDTAGVRKDSYLHVHTHRYTHDASILRRVSSLVSLRLTLLLGPVLPTLLTSHPWPCYPF